MIAEIDTGYGPCLLPQMNLADSYRIDYMHPALGGGFGPGFKVAFGYDLVGDAYTGSESEKSGFEVNI